MLRAGETRNIRCSPRPISIICTFPTRTSRNQNGIPKILHSVRVTFRFGINSIQFA